MNGKMGVLPGVRGRNDMDGWKDMEKMEGMEVNWMGLKQMFPLS